MLTLFRKAIFVLSIASLTIWSNPVEGLFEFDKDSYTGTASLQFLKLPQGARPLGMGGNIAAIDIQPTTVHWNPAALADINSYWSVLSHTEIFGEWRHEYIATTVPSPFSKGTFGFAGNVLMATPFNDARDIYENRTSFYATDVAISAGYGAYLIPEIFSMGVTGSFLASIVEDYTGLSGSLDISARGKLVYGMYSSFSINNISPGITYDSETDKGNKIPAAFQASLGKPIDEYPFAWALGYTKTNDGYQVVNGGLEFALFNRMFFTRGGYEHSLFDNELDWTRGISLGAGFVINSLTIDYGFKMVGELGNYHAVSINFADVPKVARKPMNWLAKAQKAFSEGNCTDATTYAKNHYKQYPANLEALNIIQRCSNIEKEQSGMYAHIVFTANTQSRVSPVWISDSPIGGLSRRSSVFKNQQQRFPQTLLLDAGVLFDSDSPDLTTNSALITHGYDYLGYHSVHMSRNEYPYAQQDKPDIILPWIQSQLEKKSFSTHITQAHYSFNKFDVAVVGFIANNSVAQTPLPNYIQEFNKIRSTWKKRPDLVIALLDGGIKDAEQLALSAAQIHLIILSGGQQKFDRPVKINNSLIVCPGTQGTHVGAITFYFNNENAVESYKHKLIALSSDIPTDTALSNLLKETIDNKNTTANNRTVNRYLFENFLYLKEVLDNKHSIYVHDANKNYNYRVTEPGVYRSVRLAATQSKFIYIEQNPQGDQLYVKNTRDSIATKIKTGNKKVYQAEWDALENWIYFTQKQSSTISDLYRVTALGYDRINLSNGKYGHITHFDVAPNGRNLAFESKRSSISSLYHSAMGLGKPSLFSAPQKHSIRPLYSPNSKMIAYLEQTKIINTKDTLYNLVYWDILIDTTYTVCRDKKIDSFNWSKGGDQIFFSSGTNVHDINRYTLATDKTSKLNTSVSTGNEVNPRPYSYLKIDGLLFNYQEGDNSSIYWQSFSNKKIFNLIDNSGRYTLPQ